MYERIYQTLSFFANNPETPELEKKRAALALEEFSETHIQTLDSYCNSIVKQAANRYGIRPDFTAGGSDSFEDIKKLALPYVLQIKKGLVFNNIQEPDSLKILHILSLPLRFVIIRHLPMLLIFSVLKLKHKNQYFLTAGIYL